MAITEVSGRGDIGRLDVATRKFELLTADVLVGPGAIDAGDDATVYFGQLGDPSLMSIRASATEVVFVPPFEVWSNLAWSRPHPVFVNDEPAESVVTAVESDGGRPDPIYSTPDRIDSLWTDPDGAALLVAHAPYPEVELDAGSTFTLIRGREQTELATGRMNVAKTASMTPDLTTITFVESNTHRLGSLHISDGSIQWIGKDVDGAEVSSRGRLATFTRTADPTSDDVCLL